MRFNSVRSLRIGAGAAVILAVLGGVGTAYSAKRALEAHSRAQDMHLALLLIHRGAVRDALARPAESEPQLEEDLKLYQRAFPGGHPMVVLSLTTLASVKCALSRHGDAELLYAEAVDVCRRLHSVDPLDLLRSVKQLAETRIALGKFAEAQRDLDEAILLDRQLNPDGSAASARLHWQAGQIRFKTQGAQAGLPHLEAAVEIAERFLPETHKALQEYRKTRTECREAAEGLSGR